MVRVFVFLICCFPFLGWAQSTGPYQLSPAVDAPLLSAGLGLSITGFVLDRTTTPLTQQEVDAIDPATNPKFDRYSTRQNSKSARIASDVLFYSAAVAPLGLFANREMRKDWLVIGIMYGETFLLNTGATLITKGTVLRSRPYVFNPDVDPQLKLSKSARHSFFSGHTSTTSSMCFFTAKVWADYHPDSKLKPLVWSLAAAAPAAVGWFRIQGGRHYPSDVITGYAVGALIGWGVPMLHRKKEAKVSFVPFSGKYQGVNMLVRF